MSNLPIFEHFLSVRNLKPYLVIFQAETQAKIFSIESGFRGLTIKDVVEGLTNNEDLREVLAYRWNLLAVPPNELPFTVHGGFEQLVGG